MEWIDAQKRRGEDSEGEKKTYRKIDISSSVALCEIQSFLIDIDSDNPPSTKCLSYGHTKQTDWSSTKYDTDLKISLISSLKSFLWHASLRFS